MKKFMIAALALGLTACQQGDENNESADKVAQESAATSSIIAEANAADASVFSNEDQKASYAIGLKYGEAMSRDVKELDLDLFYKGLTHGFKGEKPMLDPQEVMTTLKALQTRKMEEMQAKQEQASSANKEEGEAYLAANKAKDGVKVTESGLQYEVISSGADGGASPDANDKVKVHYHGTLVDGSVFDSSVDRGQPIEFEVGGVIKGWTEALQLMKKGDKWKLTIPSELAYGPRGAGPKIGPNSVLVFDVELLDVIPQE
ncbi:MAG: FKBP-type peptidyl-prolyl cis-trans isomerase [Pseudomonadales bacterium]|nr:FKBP-type peptidyl-prolyl cis-trans isomerase [Pseudomonadales bacterium]